MKRALLETLVQGGARPWVRALDRVSQKEKLIDPLADDSALGLAARAAARADASSEIEIDGRTWFLEVHNPPLELVLVGAVHIAQPLAAMAAMAGYVVRVIDPRTAFATEARFPGMRLIHDWPDQALTSEPLGPRSALVSAVGDRHAEMVRPIGV